MAAPRLTESPRDPQDEVRRVNRQYDRTPVAAVAGAYTMPFVICRDGSCWQMWQEPVGEGDRRTFWKEVPPVPGSQRAESYTEGPDGDSPDGPFLPEDGPVERMRGGR
jgi:hypothetical protein